MAILPVGIGSSEAGGYQVERSLRFNSADSAYLNRTPASAGNRRTWTLSFWHKRSKISESALTPILGTPSNTDLIGFDTDDVLRVWFGTNTYNIETTQVFRDVSAWGHWVISVDTTQGTSSNRVKIYYNGSQITAFSTASYPTQNYDTGVNNTVEHRIGRMPSGDYNYLNGYLAEMHLIDGSALTPSSFGETDTDTGVWKPKAYSGSYGTNGFYLDFGDNSSTTALGYDAAGSNDWTPNNFSVTAGAGNDSLVDSPTRYGTDTGVGGEVRGNYATLNPLQSAGTLSNGNLAWTGPTANGTSIGTLGVTSGKWYFECNLGSTSNKGVIGLVRDPQQADINTDGYSGNISGRGYAIDFETSPPKLKFNGTATDYGTQPTATSDILMVAIDLTNNSIFFGMNGTWYNSSNPATNTSPAYSSITAGTYFPFVADQWGSASSSWVVNFGQRPFAYTAPSGFKALCTTNLPEPTIAEGRDYMNAVLYTGNNSNGKAVTGVGFSPDFIWFKSRSAANGHCLVNRLTGVDKGLGSDSTAAEQNPNLASFDSDGFTVNSVVDFSSTNANGNSIVAWNWKANGAGVSNTAGTINSTVSANTTAGFSIVNFQGNGTTGTVGHGLGVAPSLIILKDRDFDRSWPVYHSAVSPAKYLYLNQTAAATDSGAINCWGNNTTTVAATSTVFTVGNATAWNGRSGDDYIAYCFAPIAGYSAFGSYTGNGNADGPFVYTGFRPRYVLARDIDAVSYWWIYDTVRSTYNAAPNVLFTNVSDAEATYAYMDILSNGFKIRTVTGGDLNASGRRMIYAAFAENPYKVALAR